MHTAHSNTAENKRKETLNASHVVMRSYRDFIAKSTQITEINLIREVCILQLNVWHVQRPSVCDFGNNAHCTWNTFIFMSQFKNSIYICCVFVFVYDIQSLER